MAWLKLEPRFRQHPKTLAVSIRAAWLHVCGLCYATEYLTDGVIPAAVVPTLDRRLRDTNSLISELVAVGLWCQTDTGYLIHDYLVYNLSADEVKDMEEKKASAGRLGGERSVLARQKRYGTTRPIREALAEASASDNTKQNTKQVLHKSTGRTLKHREANREASPIRSEEDTDPPPTSSMNQPPPETTHDGAGPGSLMRPESREEHRRCRLCGDEWVGGPRCPKQARHGKLKPEPSAAPVPPARVVDIVGMALDAAILPAGGGP